MNDRMIALCLACDWNLDDIKEGYDEKHYDVGKNYSYLVVTDEEADELWDQELDNYIDECLEIPDAIRNYFDEEKWKDDARGDGRASSLSTYNDSEEEIDLASHWDDMVKLIARYYEVELMEETYIEQEDHLERMWIEETGESFANYGDAYYIYRV